MDSEGREIKSNRANFISDGLRLKPETVGPGGGEEKEKGGKKTINAISQLQKSRYTLKSLECASFPQRIIILISLRFSAELIRSSIRTSQSRGNAIKIK